MASLCSGMAGPSVVAVWLTTLNRNLKPAQTAGAAEGCDILIQLLIVQDSQLKTLHCRAQTRPTCQT
jgi:hypothetical protein